MQEEIPESLANRLSSMIQGTGLTKKTFAERCQIHPVTLSKYLSGKRIPATDELHRIARTLNVSTEWLLAGTGKNKPIEYSEPSRTFDLSVMEEPGVYGSLDHKNILERLVTDQPIEWLLDRLDEFAIQAKEGDAKASDAIAFILPKLRKRINSQRNERKS